MRIQRPWGWYEDLLSGSGYKVKRLFVRAGCQLSLQRHRHRSESWTVVAGSGSLFCDDKWHKASPGLMLSISYGSVHRAKAGKKDLIILEVQHGDYLTEDDIERLEDDYGRAPNKKHRKLAKIARKAQECVSRDEAQKLLRKARKIFKKLENSGRQSTRERADWTLST